VSLRVWDAVVVGAGPAGSLSALELRRRGLEVLLLDRARFPRRKVCGGCLSRGAAEVLRCVGLGDLPRAAGAHPLTRITLAGWQSDASVPLGGGWALSRKALDQALVAAATREGVTFEDGAYAQLLPPSGSLRRLSIRKGGREALVAARVVVAADGLGGGLLRAGGSGLREMPDPKARVGLGARVVGSDGPFEPGVITMAVGEEGYVGLVRVEDDSLNIAAAVDPGFLARSRGVGVGVASLLRRAGVSVPEGLEDADWRGTPALTRRVRTLAADRAFRVGDATGYVEPFTGEGMSWALTAARALAPIAALAAERWEPGFVRLWEDVHARSIGRAQRACRAAAWALRRPSLARLVLDALATTPSLAFPFVRAVSARPTL